MKPSNEDTTLTSDIKQKMCSVLEEKYRPAALQKLLAKAYLEDPRYRGNHYDDDTKETKSALTEEMLAVVDAGSGASASAVVERESLAQVAKPPAEKKKLLGDLLKLTIPPQPYPRELEPIPNSHATSGRTPSPPVQTHSPGGATTRVDFLCSPKSPASTCVFAHRHFIL